MPTRADPTALGTLPIAAYRYCAAVTEASQFGWYVFSPLDIQVAWDGSETLWSYTGNEVWHPLTSVQHPGFEAIWDKTAPDELKGLSPPFVSSTHHAGVLQIWTGLFIRTAPQWSTLLRAPANIAAAAGFQLYEGIVETDQWFGPLFVNLRLTKTDYPIRFSAETPLFQVQPIQRHAYSHETLSRTSTVEGLGTWAQSDWLDYARIMERKSRAGGSVGGYATHVRKRSKRSS